MISFSVILMLKALKLFILLMWDLHFKGIQSRPLFYNFPWKVSVKLQLQWKLFREMLILRSYFSCFQSIIAELQ